MSKFKVGDVVVCAVLSQMGKKGKITSIFVTFESGSEPKYAVLWDRDSSPTVFYYEYQLELAQPPAPAKEDWYVFIGDTFHGPFNSKEEAFDSRAARVSVGVKFSVIKVAERYDYEVVREVREVTKS